MVLTSDQWVNYRTKLGTFFTCLSERCQPKQASVIACSRFVVRSKGGAEYKERTPYARSPFLCSTIFSKNCASVYFTPVRNGELKIFAFSGCQTLFMVMLHRWESGKKETWDSWLWTILKTFSELTRCLRNGKLYACLHTTNLVQTQEEFWKNSKVFLPLAASKGLHTHF